MDEPLDLGQVVSDGALPGVGFGVQAVVGEVVDHPVVNAQNKQLK